MQGGTLFRFATLAVILACHVQVSSNRAEQQGKSRREKVQIHVTLAKTEYVVSEGVFVNVSIFNESGMAITVPDPVDSRNADPRYSLTGPQYPAGFTFSPLSAAHGEGSDENGHVEVTKTLAPGQHLEAQLPLSMMASFRQPGRYQLTAQINYGGLSSQSAPVSFTVEAPVLDSVSIGVDEGRPVTDVWVMWLDGRAGQKRLYQSLYINEGTSHGGFQTHVITPLGPVGQHAADMLAPWANYDRTSTLSFWRAWRDASKLYAFAGMATKPLVQDLGAAPDQVLRPALMTSSGELDIVAVSQAGAELLLARFPQVKQDGTATTSPSLRRMSLTTPAVGGRSALGPAVLHGDRHVVLTAQDASWLVIQHLNLGSGDETSVQAVRIPNAFALRQSEPGMSVEANGDAKVAVVFGRDREGRHLALADVVFSRSGNPPAEPRISELGEFAAPLRAAAAQFTLEPNPAPLRYWAALMTDGEFVTGGRPGASRTTHPKFRPAIPLELLPLADGVFLLTLDEEGPPRLTFLP